MTVKERLMDLFGETSERLVKAYKQAKYCFNDYVGGLENTIQDYPESSEEYKRAAKLLANGDELRETIYKEAFFSDAVYFDGGMAFNRKSMVEDLRFVGADKMHKIVDFIVAAKSGDFIPCSYTMEAFKKQYNA